VAVLLAAGALKNPLDSAGQTPMVKAANGGHAQVVRLFYNSGQAALEKHPAMGGFAEASPRST
jgi:ankyrin repeat protein